MLTIKNYDKIKDSNINCMGQLWKVVDIGEGEHWYELAFSPEMQGIFALHQTVYVKVFRQVEPSGFEYQISFNDNASRGLNKIHNQYLKHPKDLLNWISSKYLVNINVC
jgi:hypothetical protein